MKSRYKIVFLIIAIAMTGIFTNCSDDGPGGAPMISYVRITNPASSDSLLVAAGQGQMVAIMGQNLQHTVQLWFNDQQAALTTTFITSTSIITRVPTELPEVITNQVKLIFDNGESLIYDFSVDVSKPLISRMKSEYVNTGEVATFYGDYFYEPVVVTFTGGVEAEIVAVEDQVLEVIVPDGVQPGPVAVTTNFGEVVTDFWFRDNRNIILGFENMSGANGQGVSSGPLWHPAAGDFNRASSSIDGIPSINGNYLYNPFGADGYGAWEWNELWAGNAPAPEMADLVNIPEEALVDPSGFNLKFEVLTIGGSLSGAWFSMWIGNNINDLAARGPVDGQPNANLYTWQPNLDTNGEWQTITIPWSEFYAYGALGGFDYGPTGYDISIVLQGPNSASAQVLAIDNVRVVPNTND